MPGFDKVCFDKARSENLQKMKPSGLAESFGVEEAEERDDSTRCCYCCRTSCASNYSVFRSTDISKNGQRYIPVMGTERMSREKSS